MYTENFSQQNQPERNAPPMTEPIVSAVANTVKMVATKGSNKISMQKKSLKSGVKIAIETSTSKSLDDVLKLRQTIAVHKAALKKMRDVRPRRSVSLDDVATSPPPVGAEDPLFFCCTDEPMDDFDGDDDIGRLPGPSGEELPLPSWTLTPVDESSPPRPFGKRSCRDARRSSRIVRRPRLVRCDGAFDAGRRLA